MAGDALFEALRAWRKREAEAPGVFEVGKVLKVRILFETPGDAVRTAVEQAVKSCPTHALKIVDD